MPRPKTKDKLLEASQLEFEKLLSLVEPLTEKVINKGGGCEIGLLSYKFERKIH